MFNFLLSYLFIINKPIYIKTNLYCELNKNNITATHKNKLNGTNSKNMDAALIPLNDIPKNKLIWKNLNQNHP